MNQFTVYENENETTRSIYPYVVDVQNNLLNALNSRLVIPLAPHKSLRETNAEKLCPVFKIEENNFVLVTPQLASIPVNTLTTKVASLEHYQKEINNAIDLIITGI